MLALPMNASVHWNVKEKVIGVIGVAPAATADFYRKVVQLTPAKKDWEHVRVIIDSNPKIPSRGRHIELGETDPVPYIRQSIEKLQEMGATIFAIPCNTAHIFYSRYTENFLTPIVHMVEVTASAVAAIKSIGTKAALFASKLTQNSGLYQKAFTRNGVTLIDTSSYQNEISDLIERVKQGESVKLLRQKMKNILNAHSHANIFILGCTELSLLLENNFQGTPIIDSNTELAKACLALANNDAYNSSINIL